MDDVQTRAALDQVREGPTASRRGGQKSLPSLHHTLLGIPCGDQNPWWGLCRVAGETRECHITQRRTQLLLRWQAAAQKHSPRAVRQ